MGGGGGGGGETPKFVKRFQVAIPAQKLSNGIRGLLPFQDAPELQ